MGSCLSTLWWGGDPDTPNVHSGLSRRDVHLVRKSWVPIYRQRVKSGTLILTSLFRANPPTKEHFAMLRGVAEADFGQNHQFTAHVINLMTSLNMVLQTLDQPEVAAAMLVKIGDSHNRRKIPIANYETLKEVLVQLFSEVLKFDGATMAAWGRAITFLYQHIYPRLENKR